MHVHFHIIPKSEAGGLGVGWPARGLEDDEALDLVAGIRAALEEEPE